MIVKSYIHTCIFKNLRLANIRLAKELKGLLCLTLKTAHYHMNSTSPTIKLVDLDLFHSEACKSVRKMFKHHNIFKSLSVLLIPRKIDDAEVNEGDGDDHAK